MKERAESNNQKAVGDQRLVLSKAERSSIFRRSSLSAYPLVSAGSRPPSSVGGHVSSLVPHPSSLALWLSLLLFASYLLSFSGRITSSDGLSMFAVTESFVKRGDLTTDQMFTLFGTKSAPAPDGEVYSKYGYGTSLFAAPLYLLALYVPFGGLMQVTLLACAVAVAITGALVYLAAQRLNFSTTVALILALLFGLATPAWVYAKEFWSESFALVTLFATYYVLLVSRDSLQNRAAVLAGILVGLAIAVRTTNVLLVPLYAAYAFINFRPFQIRGRALIAFLIPVLVFILSVLFYNALRFGNPFTTGYRADEDFSNPLLLGAYGLLFSPGKGLFVYAPFLAALPFGVWQFWKRVSLHRELIFSILFFLFNLILFSAWYYWWGGTNWAARFLVPTLPFLVLLCAPLIELLLTPNKNRTAQIVLIIICALLVIISFLNELAGVAINSLTYRLRTVTLSSNPDWDAIFSPALSPLVGYWQIFKASNLDFAWVRAAPDSVQFDWILILLTLGFIAFCVWGLIQALRGQSLSRALTALTLLAAV
ncbi:MAG TPA: glycosyltransferase family 39 protein, partial [Anaerolineae bacterium]|nr:glycosyltransferase family 39 protein [Anaerolineae bacterium]